MAEKYGDQKAEQDLLNLNQKAFSKEVGSLLSTAKGDAYMRENLDDFVTSLTDVSNPSQLEVTVVARAVDDGMVYATETTWEHENTEKNVHKLTDTLRRTRESMTHRIHNLTDGVKSKVEHVSASVKSTTASVKSTAMSVGDSIKHEVVVVDRKVKANPYLFALGAVGVGFVLGRMFLSTRKPKLQTVVLKDYQEGMNEHTGIHVRERSRFA